jgi:hypothetical protein
MILGPQLSLCRSHTVDLLGGRAGNLAMCRSARKGPALALPTLWAEHRSSRATSSASPSVSATRRYQHLAQDPSLQCADSSAPARSDYAGHFAHAALQPVKAYVPRHALHDLSRIQVFRQDAGGKSQRQRCWTPLHLTIMLCYIANL